MSTAWTTGDSWRSGLCDCCDDLSSCLLSFFCPCAQFAYNAGKIDGSSWCGACCLYVTCSAVGCACLIHASKRTNLRAMYGLQESCCCDCCVAYLCSTLALAQEHRELAARGPPPARQAMGASPTSIVIHNSNAGSSNSSQPQQQQQQQQMQPQYAVSADGHMIAMQQLAHPQAVSVYPQLHPPAYSQHASPQYSTSGPPPIPPPRPAVRPSVYTYAQQTPGQAMHVATRPKGVEAWNETSQ